MSEILGAGNRCPGDAANVPGLIAVELMKTHQNRDRDVYSISTSRVQGFSSLQKEDPAGPKEQSLPDRAGHA